VPELPWLDDPAWAVIHGMEPLAARYSQLVDNLLDLSHETYLHAGFIGTPDVAVTPIEATVDEDADIVRVSRHMASVECPPPTPVRRGSRPRSTGGRTSSITRSAVTCCTRMWQPPVSRLGPTAAVG
jgi:phenylpropionate dioxygenase-like ring-hydroxylating dioxygenase large terminal subunit